MGKYQIGEAKKSIPMIPVLLLYIIDEASINLSMRWSTAGEYDRPWNTTLLRDQRCKVDSGKVSSCRAIQVSRMYWKSSNSYAFAAVATNLVC